MKEPGARRALWTQQVRRGAAPLLLAAAVAALAIRVAGRDAWRPLAPLFYASPLGVVLLWSVAATAIAAFQRRRALALAGAAAVVLSGTWLLANEWRSGDATGDGTGRPPLRGLLWNAQGRRADWTERAEAARALDPDLLVVLEGPANPDDAERLTRAFPGHSALALPARRFVLARGATVRRTQWPGPAETVDDFPVVEARFASASVRLLLTDLPSSPFRDRGPTLARVLERVLASGDRRVLVLGDFNTPRDSALLDPWRGPLANAFESAGTGWGPTWPSILPVLALDQVWAGPGIEVRRCSAAWTLGSDHRPVEFDFDVVE